jgi:hypothetical protein
MADPAEAYDAVCTYFGSNWTETRIAGQGLTLSPKPAQNEDWVRFSMDGNLGGQQTLGDPNAGDTVDYRYLGVIIIQCFVPLDAGKLPALQMATRILNLFRGKSVSTVWFRDFTPQTIGPTEDGWYQVNVVGEFVNNDTQEGFTP